MWRGRVASAMRGRRGQKLLREALTALDEMPVKRLIAEELVNDEGEVCLLGACGPKYGVADLDKIDPEDHDTLAARFDVAPCLIQEIEYENDEAGPYGRQETPEERYERVRKWLVRKIKPDEQEAKAVPHVQ
jgi:hypothetical protein